MAKLNSRPLYEPPQARDLSATGVTGQTEPLGICESGSIPYTLCKVGSDVAATCSEGLAVGNCSTGTNVNVYPQCKAGSNAIVGCTTGTVA
jgi:hypothetical protein